MERAQWALERQAMGQELFMIGIRDRNPSASECELLALWTERSYRAVAPELLEKAVAAIRARGAAAPNANRL